MVKTRVLEYVVRALIFLRPTAQSLAIISIEMLTMAMCCPS